MAKGSSNRYRLSTGRVSYPGKFQNPLAWAPPLVFYRVKKEFEPARMTSVLVVAPLAVALADDTLDDDVVYWYSFSNHYTKRAFTQP